MIGINEKFPGLESWWAYWLSMGSWRQVRWIEKNDYSLFYF